MLGALVAMASPAPLRCSHFKVCKTNGTVAAKLLIIKTLCRRVRKQRPGSRWWCHFIAETVRNNID